MATVSGNRGNKNGAVLLLGRPAPHPQPKLWGLVAQSLQLSSNFEANNKIVISCYDRCVIICIYEIWTDTTVPQTDTDSIFTTRVDPVSAPPKSVFSVHLPAFALQATVGKILVTIAAQSNSGFWWSRRALPPGPRRLFHKAFSIIVGLPRPFQYRG